MPAGNTFTVFAERVDPEAGFDGLLAVLNNATVQSGRLMAIESVRVWCPSPINPDLTNILGTNGKISLDRVTAYSGGTEVSSIKFDTNSTSLPSQVKLMLFPDSVTSPTKIRQFGDAVSTYNITTSISFQAMQRAPGVCDASESGRNVESHNVLHKASHSELEPIILREGEGLAAIQREFSVPQASHWSFTIRVSGTGKTYRYRVLDSGSPYGYDDPKWVLFNGSGSGVVLEVWVVNFSDLGEQNIPKLRITRIGGIDLSIGNPSEISIIKHDTNADFSDIKAYHGDFKAKSLAYGQGVPITYHDYQGVPMTVAIQQTIDTFRQFLMAEPKYSLTHAPVMRFENECERWPGDRRGVNAIDDEIILHPGEGIAVIGGGNGSIETSELAYFNIEIIGRVYSNVSASVGYQTVGNSGLIKVA